jgi:single-stranded DNA-binding protein
MLNQLILTGNLGNDPEIFFGSEGDPVMAGATRLELATSGVTGRRSNQTELRPRK